MSRSLVLLVPLLAVATGCSGGDFALATGPDDAAPADAASDASVITDTAEPPGDASSDAGEADSTGEDARGEDAPTVDAPVDAAKPCFSNAECTPGLCSRRGCEAKTGVCLPIAGSATYRPVCGCDGVTYWNELFAASHSVGVSHDEPCLLVEAKTCAGERCDDDLPGSACVVTGANADVCASIEKGTCWKLPTGKLCGADPGPAVQTCKGACSSQCGALRDGITTFYTSSCMP